MTNNLQREVAAAAGQLLMEGLGEAMVRLFGREPKAEEMTEYCQHRWGDRVIAQTVNKHDVAGGCMMFVEIRVDFDRIPNDVVERVKQARKGQVPKSPVYKILDAQKCSKSWEGDDDED
jgi:hypothetical protein